MSESKVLCEHVIAGGWNYSRIVRRGQKIRLTDLEGGAISAASRRTAVFTVIWDASC